MKKFYYSFILAFFTILTSINAQETLPCGDTGSSFTASKLELSQYRRSGCSIDYDFTIVAAEVGRYRVRISTFDLLRFNVTQPGIFRFQGQANQGFPCILISNFINAITLQTPSGRCNLEFDFQLPVKLVAFTATEEEGAAVLRWTTSTELNNEGFFIEHTQNGEDWASLGFVEGVGTTNETQNYDYRIEGLPKGEHYFRLKQKDFDGRVEYFSVVTLELKDASKVLKVFPNPLGRGQALNIQGSYEQASLYNASGQLIQQFQASGDFSNIHPLDVPAGFYQLMIQRDGEILSRKLVVR